jgi:hypothetical protein
MILIRGGISLDPINFIEFYCGKSDKVIYYEIFIVAENVQSILLGLDGDREFLVPHRVNSGLFQHLRLIFHFPILHNNEGVHL